MESVSLWTPIEPSHTERQLATRLDVTNTSCLLKWPKASHIASVPTTGTKTKQMSSILATLLNHPPSPSPLLFPLKSKVLTPSFSFSLPPFLPLTFLLNQPPVLTSYFLFHHSLSLYPIFPSCSTRISAPLRQGFRLSPLALFLVLRKREAELRWTVSARETKKEANSTQYRGVGAKSLILLREFDFCQCSCPHSRGFCSRWTTLVNLMTGAYPKLWKSLSTACCTEMNHGISV